MADASDLSNARSLEAAKAAGLRYVDGKGPGIERRRCGRGFIYLGPDRRPIHDRQQLHRIGSLAIPPAWARVWICPTSTGHIQAVGWDAKGRKQYRYHALFREVRDRSKFGRMVAFGTVLAVIRGRVRRDLRRSGPPREKVLAAMVRLLETTCIRVGNDEYARENDSFGLTTLRNRHVRSSGATLRFRFKGKSGLWHAIELNDRTVSRIVRQCQELPGRLFQYIDEDGALCNVDSEDVNTYLREITGQEFSAKDFRTGPEPFWLRANWLPPGDRAASAKLNNVVEATKRVAQRLGNRLATCRKYYIHPAIIDAFSDHSLFETMRQGEEQHAAYNGHGLSPESIA